MTSLFAEDRRMNLRISGKRALVTGSTAGIGLAIARHLAAEGAHVFINGRTAERVQDALKQIEGTKTGIVADLSTAEGCKTLFGALPQTDILVNNLGIFETKPFLEIDDADWIRFFETNVLSGVRVTRKYLPEMLKSRWGRVLFISSESAVNIPPEMVHYGMTKTAQVAIARGIAESFPASGVTINSVLVGPTDSEGVGAMFQKAAAEQGRDAEDVQQEFIREKRPSSLTQRLETTDEIASMVTYLCSATASGTTGAAVRVEGGLLRSIL